MTKERYYAVRIGDPRYDHPYFMLDKENMVPALFATRNDAQKAAPIQSRTQVVLVILHDSMGRK